MSERDIVALGLDAGSTTTKVVGVDGDGQLCWHRLEPTEPHMEAQAERLIRASRVAASGAERPLVATGYGRALVRQADRRVTEITCHARGAFAALGHGGTLIDIGGQDSKVIAITADGKVESFAMNDKCAAGTGRFLEVTAARLELSLEALSEAALAASSEVAISSTCTVFAESEIISLLAHGEALERIVRGLHRSLVKRVATLARGSRVRPPVMLSGGVAHSRAMVELLGAQLGQRIEVPPEPQLMGAYGAALVARGG